MHHVTSEIEAQPAAWRRVIGLLPSMRDALPGAG